MGSQSPVPLTGIVCWVNPPLALTKRPALRSPAAVGANFTLMMHLELGARVVGQLSV